MEQPTKTIHGYFTEIMKLLDAAFYKRDPSNPKEKAKIDREQAWNWLKDIREDDPNKVDLVVTATREALHQIDQHCGLILLAQDEKLFVSSFPEGKMIDGNIAYISLPESMLQKDFATYAKIGRNVTTQLLAQHPIGAIVDLRGNRGGGCYQMIATLAPFLDRENHVRWADEHHVCTPGLRWDHQVGRLKNGDYKDTEYAEYHTANETCPVAVIHDEVTCSSGEIMALILRGSPLSKSFGKATFGNSTGNVAPDSPFPEIFGKGFITIPNMIMADRNHKVYGTKIKPDETCDNPMEHAIEWIRAFPR